MYEASMYVSTYMLANFFFYFVLRIIHPKGNRGAIAHTSCKTAHVNDIETLY